MGDAATLPRYIDIYRSTPSERIGLIKSGVPASLAKRMGRELRMDQERLFRALSLKRATVNRKADGGRVLALGEGERVIGLAKLVGQVEAMVEESGDPQGFDAREWLANWLAEPLPALGGVAPIDRLDTMEGQAEVSRALARLQSGAYA